MIATIHMKIISADVHVFVSIIRIQIRVVSVIRTLIHVCKEVLRTSLMYASRKTPAAPV